LFSVQDRRNGKVQEAGQRGNNCRTIRLGAKLAPYKSYRVLSSQRSFSNKRRSNRNEAAGEGFNKPVTVRRQLERCLQATSMLPPKEDHGKTRSPTRGIKKQHRARVVGNEKRLHPGQQAQERAGSIKALQVLHSNFKSTAEKHPAPGSAASSRPTTRGNGGPPAEALPQALSLLRFRPYYPTVLHQPDVWNNRTKDCKLADDNDTT